MALLMPLFKMAKNVLAVPFSADWKVINKNTEKNHFKVLFL
jgi:hypothetical protein